MKKLMTVLVCVCLVAALIGCDVPGPEAATGAPTTETTRGTEREKSTGLTVYYLNETVSTARNIVNQYITNNRDVTVDAVAFDSIEEMDRRIIEELSEGEGPDVILFPDATTVDTTKLALNERFLDLSDMLAEDSTFDPENYYPVLDAGVIGGRQYLMPLRMKVMYMMTTQDRFTNELALTEDYTLAQLMEALMENASQCGPEENVAFTMHSFDAYLYNLLRLTGLEVLDLDRLSQTVSQENLLEYSAFAEVSYDQCLKAAKQMREYGNGNLGEMLRRNTAILSNQSLPCNLRYYGAIYSQGLGEEIQLLVYPDYKNREELTADISLYAAVLNTTEKPWEAYSFVRSAMDNSFSNINEQLPVSKAGVDSLLALLGANRGKLVSVGNQTVMVDKMTPEHQGKCEELLGRITAGSIPNAGVKKIFTDTMMPCITREADFDICYQDLQKELELYLNEVYE